MRRHHATPLTPEAQHQRMTTIPISRLVTKLAIPGIISQMVSVTYNLADTFFVARLGTSQAAAIGVTFALTSIIQAFGFGIGTGVGSLVSRALGAKRNKDAERYCNSAMFAGFAIGSLVTIIGLMILPTLMLVLGSTPTMLPYSTAFARVILFGSPILCTACVCNCVLRSEGEPYYAMTSVTLSAITNIILDPILIYKLHMGVQGAALATVISQALMLLVVLYPYLTKKSIVPLNLKAISKDWQTYKDIFITGFPTLSRQGMASLGSVFLTVSASSYGDAAVAAITITNKLYLFVRQAVLGIGQGFQPVAGYNYGAGNKERTMEAFVFATKFGTIVCLVASALLLTHTELVISWFQKDAEVLAIGRRALVYASLVIPLMAFSTYVNQLYQCLGFSKQATILACCRNGICLIPILLIFTPIFHLSFVEMAQPIADLLTFIISVPYLMAFVKYKLDNSAKVNKS